MAGTVVKRKTRGGKIRWQAKLRLGKDADGKWIWRTDTFDTQREGKEALRRWEQENWVPKTTQTLEQYMLHWMHTVKRHTLRPTSYQSYLWQVRQHILPHLGPVALADLTTDMIQAHYSRERDAGRRDGRPLSPRMVRYSHSILKQALAHAVRAGVLAANPADAAVPPRAAPRPAGRWSEAEAARFLEAAQNTTYAPLWLVALATGLRLGELLGLRWADVDLERGTLRVEQAVAPIRGLGTTLQAPKTAAGVRTLRIGRGVADALRAHRVRQREAQLAARDWEDHDYVFATRRGTAITASNLRRAYVALQAKAGVPRIRLHDLRHTNASTLVEAGVGLDTVSKRLGHADSRITQHLYVRGSREAEALAAEAIEERLLRRER